MDADLYWLTLSHLFVDLLKPVAKTITSNGCDSPFLNTTSLPLMLVSAGKTWVCFFLLYKQFYIICNWI